MTVELTDLQSTLSMIRRLTMGGTPLLAMQRYAPMSVRETCRKEIREPAGGKKTGRRYKHRKLMKTVYEFSRIRVQDLKMVQAFKKIYSGSVIWEIRDGKIHEITEVILNSNLV